MTPICTCLMQDDATCACSWPWPGTRVRIIERHVTRMVGDDTEAEYIVPLGAIGTMRGYVREWYHLDIQLDADGANVWVSPDAVTLLDPMPDPNDKPALIGWLESETP